MNDSTAKTLVYAPSVRNAETHFGVAARAFGVHAADRTGVELQGFAMLRLSGNTPCEWVHTVSEPALNSATAQDGPIEAWAI